MFAFAERRVNALALGSYDQSHAMLNSREMVRIVRRIRKRWRICGCIGVTGSRPRVHRLRP